MQEVGTLWMEAMGSCRAVSQERNFSLEGTVRGTGDRSVWELRRPLLSGSYYFRSLRLCWCLEARLASGVG